MQVSGVDRARVPAYQVRDGDLEILSSVPGLYRKPIPPEWPQWFVDAWQRSPDATPEDVKTLFDDGEIYFEGPADWPRAVKTGDWVILVDGGSLLLCPPDIFESTYESS